jgi:hypothetical protein
MNKGAGLLVKTVKGVRKRPLQRAPARATGRRNRTKHAQRSSRMIATYLKFATKDGFVSLKDVQLEGKKRMGIEDFLRGVKL